MMKPIKIFKIGFACSLFLAFSCPDKKTNLEDVSTETVYQMTKLVFESLPELVAAHSAANPVG